MRRWLPPHRTGRSSAERTEYRGRWYQSKAEARYARDLDLRKAAGEIKDWTPQFAVKFTAPSGALVWKHLVDFRIEHADGSVELVEVKGHAEEAWKLKRKVLELVILPGMNADKTESIPEADGVRGVRFVPVPKTRYTVLDRSGRPWEAPKRRKSPRNAEPGGSWPPGPTPLRS